MEDSERDSFKKVKLVDYPMHLNILRGDYISVIVMQERKGKVIIAYSWLTCQWHLYCLIMHTVNTVPTKPVR